MANPPRLPAASSESESSTPSPSPRSASSTTSAHKVSKMPISLLPYVFTITVIMLCATPVQSRWCTRLVTYTTTKPYVKQSMCNQSYEESCSFFSFQMCTRYELVPCMKEENKTVTMYKIFESCCPGYRLNPLNNLTCEEIETDRYENFDGRVEFYQTESDGKLFGMTKGAYAGIVCSVVFLLCVVVLVSIRLYKRQRKNRLKAQKKQQVELEASQKMMSDTEAKSVA